MYEWVFFLFGALLAIFALIIIVSTIPNAKTRKEDNTGPLEEGQQKDPTGWSFGRVMWIMFGLLLLVFSVLIFAYGLSTTYPSVSEFYKIFSCGHESCGYNGLKIKEKEEVRELQDAQIIRYSVFRPILDHNVTFLKCDNGLHYRAHLCYGEMDANRHPLTMTVSCSQCSEPEETMVEYATDRSLFDLYKYVDILNSEGSYYSSVTSDCKVYRSHFDQFLKCGSPFFF